MIHSKSVLTLGVCCLLFAVCRRRTSWRSLSFICSLAATSQRPTSRVIVCLGGCPNFGPGAVAPCYPGAAAAELDPETLAVATEYFEALGMQSLEQVRELEGMRRRAIS